MLHRLFGILLALSALAPLSLHASVVTLTYPIGEWIDPPIYSGWSSNGPGDAVLVESQGYSYQNSMCCFSAPIQLTDDAGILQSTLQRTNGGRFNLLSMDVFAVNRLFVTGTGAMPTDDSSSEWYDWIHSSISGAYQWQIEGFRGGQSVALYSHTMPTAGYQPGDFAATESIGGLILGSLFSNLDYAVFSVTEPNFVYWDYSTPIGPQTAWCELGYCTDVQFSNIQVAAVPLPPTILLLGFGLAGLPLARLRQVRRCRA